MSTRWLIPILSLGLVACTASGEPETPEVEDEVAKEPKPEPERTPEPKPTSGTTISVSSVQMLQDCPDSPGEDIQDDTPPAQETPPPTTKKPKMRAKVGSTTGRSLRRACAQSTIQLALETFDADPVTVEVKTVRLLVKGEAVGTLVARGPTIWADSGYSPWDERLAPGGSTKASYKLGEPRWDDFWDEVEDKVAGDIYKQMFTVEIDIAIDGELQTVSSPEFIREKPHVMVT